MSAPPSLPPGVPPRPPASPAPATPLVPLTAAPPPDEAERRVALERMKRVATGMLVAAAGVFVVAISLESRWPWLAFVRATAEAAMVGGLADWFAVTALFRHPMGIPIPHTAIIPARKDRVGRSLGAFVQRNFLSRDVISAKLRAARLAERLAEWISEPEHARLVARKAAHGLASGVQLLRDEDVQAMIDRSVEGRVRATKIAPLLGRILRVVTEGGRHQELLDGAIRLLARVVTEHEDKIRDKIEAESPWWVPGMVDDKIHEKIVGGIERTLRDVRDTPDHPLRQRFDTMIEEFIEKLQHAPEVQARAEQIKTDMIDADVIRRFSSSIWTDAKGALVRYAENPDSFSPGTIERALTAVGEAMLGDPALLAKVDDTIVEIALGVIQRYEHEVSSLIESTVASWDPVATSQRIELAVGRDLQYVRINGTLVGGLAGLLLYSITRLLGHA
jgi:uncharacterized membrane-anchored protein YjiN (DUF445 family)